MPIPPCERKRFEPNPLVEVVFQARFTSLLEIETEIPVVFHEKIRDLYPLFSSNSVVDVEINSTDLSKQNFNQARRYEAKSIDGNWQIVLTSDFLAVLTKAYDNWSEFKSHVDLALAAFFSVYKPAQFTRIGLRYIDQISKESYGLQNETWKDLLQPHVAGVLSAEDINEDELVALQNQFVLSLPNDSKVTVRHGFAVNKKDQAVNDYYIDTDFYTESLMGASKDGALTSLEGFREYTNSLFQWCISERLKEAMER
ncbi:TIGR04255 family protein [Kiloniella sp. b19]|uniref:TIGR04255 family protein n=1 Tax=Kiloniella sp. GXU_MW_B19 TaxID=3141326 RepID=UPI0031D75BF5